MVNVDRVVFCVKINVFERVDELVLDDDDLEEVVLNEVVLEVVLLEEVC